LTAGLLEKDLNKRFFFCIRFSLVLLSVILIFSRCENDIKKVNLLTKKKSYPDEIAINIEIQRTDSGKILVRIFAPELQRFENIEKPYTLFPKGLTATTYNPFPRVESGFNSKWARYYEKEKIWEAKYDVQAMNYKGDKLFTEQMFWDENKKIIYSDKFTRINSSNGVFYGENGFEADENFTKWKLKNIKNSTLNFKDE
jgi:LPS export ABC transporter protein LptC